MTNVPYERIVDITVDVNDRFPTVANFSIPLLLTTDDRGNIATDLVKAFGSLDDMKTYGFAEDDVTYKAAAAMLATNNAPNTFKVGYCTTVDRYATGLTKIMAKDSLFYAIVIVDTVTAVDAAIMTTLNATLIADRKLAFFNVNDTALRDDATDTTGLAAQLRQVKPSRLVGFYSDSVSGSATSSTTDVVFGSATDHALGVVLKAEARNSGSGERLALQVPVGSLTFNELGFATIGDVTQDNAEGQFEFLVSGDISGISSFNFLDRVMEDPNFASGGSDVVLAGTDGVTQLTSSTVPFDTGDVVLVEYDPAARKLKYISHRPSKSTSTTTTAVRQYAAKAAAYVSAVNYNNPASHYTLKFKRLDGEKPSDITGTQAQNLTGFLPKTGLDGNAGGFLNCYICTAGINMVVEGITTAGTFVDLVTFTDWLISTMQTNVLAVFTNNPVVPYDAAGVSMLYSAIAETLDQALASGAATDQRTDADGNVLPAFTIDVQPTTEVSSALQSQRIGPNMRYCLRYANGIHFTEIDGTIKVAN